MWFWDRMRGSLLSDEVDPTLTELLPRRGPHRDLDALHLSRASVRVDSHLNEASPRGGLLRRMALAGFGGGGMWAGLIGVAAANKAAAAAVGLSVLLAGTVAAETTGVGPAVREAVQNVVQPSGGGDSTTPQGAHEEAAAAVEVNTDVEGVPGALLSVVSPGGHFVLRGIVVGWTGDLLTVDTGGENSFEIVTDDTRLVIPGDRDAVLGVGYPSDGALVLVEGTYNEDSGYTASLIVVLGGRAGDPPFGPLGGSEGFGASGDADQPDDPGKPEDPGRPGGLPVQSEGASDGAGKPDDVPPEDPPSDAPGRQ